MKLIIFAGPSGSGKTTISRHLLKTMPELGFSISATTRPKRESEVDGKDYYFLSVEEFRKKIANDEFAEWEEVYEGKYYGTYKSEIERVWGNRQHVVFDMDVNGALSLKKLYGSKAVNIIVTPPSIESLKARLNQRGTETEETLKYRIDKAEEEISKKDLFDEVIVNDELDLSLIYAEKIVKKFIKKEKNTILVNLYAGPGASKTSCCADIFARLKWLNIDCEVAWEYAKSVVWEENYKILENQFYVFGQQMQRIVRLKGKVDVIITDSPLLLSIIYDAKDDKTFRELIVNEHNKYNNLNFYIKRTKQYNPNGRTQTFEEAKELDKKILNVLNDNNVNYISIEGKQDNVSQMVDIILDKLKQINEQL